MTWAMTTGELPTTCDGALRSRRFREPASRNGAVSHWLDLATHLRRLHGRAPYAAVLVISISLVTVIYRNSAFN